jgi:predicted ATPase/class 3 adenylate cyclase
VTELPSGTVTFLFTDIEGSTRLWEEHPEAMRSALARHDAIVGEAVAAYGGMVVKTTGDGVHAVFPLADAGVRSALAAQLGLAHEAWGVTGPMSVRMGLHTGSAELRDGDYYGSVLNRAARLMSVAHGGQVVVSQVTEQLVRESLDPEVELVDLGEHRLRDLAAPMHVFQVTHADLGREFPPLRSLEVAIGNLPVQISSFVGRERELARLRELIGTRRLLTLTGVGGVGKTRLALQATADAWAKFPGGAWLAELARTGDPEAVGAVVVGALGAPPRPGCADLDVVCEYLGAARSILVLDNCEHVLDAAADVATAVLERCPGVVVVATSREPLDLEGEQVVPVRPLDAATDAVSLFVERAQSVDLEFVADRETVTAVEEICGRLDGVPLAVELAAARIDTMTPADIAARLDDRFRLLSSGRRRSVDRHQTLRATLEWSHQLLQEDEQMLLRRLGVFAGGFTADATRAVCGDDRVLASLVHKSLVQYERAPKPGRYRLLETVRAFALEQLAAAGEAETLGRAHAEWMAGLVDHPVEEWHTYGAIDHRLLRLELDNWREAVNFAVTTGDAALALRLSVHTLGADHPETGRWSASASTVDGITDLPGAHWLSYTLTLWTAPTLDNEALERHVDAFEQRCTDPSDRTFVAPFRAMLESPQGGDELAVIERAFAVPNLSATAYANLQLYRSLYRNLPPATDADAARHAVRAVRDARFLALPVALAFLAISLREDDPQGAIDALTQAEEYAERLGDPFQIASVAAWGSLVTLALPTAAAAAHLEARLDRLQSYYGNAEVALLTLCMCVLRRADSPAAAGLHAFLCETPAGAAVVRAIAPDLPDPAPTANQPRDFESAVGLARGALAELADGGTGDG